RPRRARPPVGRAGRADQFLVLGHAAYRQQVALREEQPSDLYRVLAAWQRHPAHRRRRVWRHRRRKLRRRAGPRAGGSECIRPRAGPEIPGHRSCAARRGRKGGRLRGIRRPGRIQRSGPGLVVVYQRSYWSNPKMTLEVNGKTYETDEEGYLANLSDWDEEVAQKMAEIDDCDLTD